MKYINIIAREAVSLTLEKQVEVLEFIKLLKAHQQCVEVASAPVSASMSLEEIKVFFRSFNVDTSNFKFNRAEANDR